MPFAGIAFLWFIGVVREQIGEVEDRLFSTVFLGSGLLFLGMLFEGAVTSTGLMEMLAGSNVNADIFAYGRSTTQALISVYAMRMAAVFTLSVSTLGLRTSAIPRWVCYLGYLVAARAPARSRRGPVDPAPLPRLGASGQHRDPPHPPPSPSRRHRIAPITPGHVDLRANAEARPGSCVHPQQAVALCPVSEKCR